MLRKIFIFICCASLFSCWSFPYATARNTDERPGFFQRHKKLKKILLLGGVGAATGGVGAVVLGHSVAGGAATGAGTKIGMHAVKEKYKDHKRKTQ